MLSLDEEDYEALGYPVDLFDVFVDLKFARVVRFREWREAFAKTGEGRAARNRRRRNSITEKLANAKRNKVWRQKPGVKQRINERHREYMRKYRATPEGKKKTQEATARYKASVKGKASKHKYYLKNRKAVT